MPKADTGVVLCSCHDKTLVQWDCCCGVVYRGYWSSGVLFSHWDMFYWGCWRWVAQRGYWSSGVMFSHWGNVYWGCWRWVVQRGYWRSGVMFSHWDNCLLGLLVLGCPTRVLEQWCAVLTLGHFYWDCWCWVVQHEYWSSRVLFTAPSPWANHHS